MILSSNRYRLLKNFAYLPLFITISACGGGGGGGGSDGDASGQQPPANTAPLAVNDSVTTSNRVSEISIDVLANDSDSDGDSLSIASVGTSTQGITPTIENGAIRYSLPENFIGADEFTYTISDGEAEATGSVTVTINSVLTISGLIGEPVSGAGNVTVVVGGELYPASLNGNRFSAEVVNASFEDTVAITAEYTDAQPGKEIVLKSYAGTIAQMNELSNDGSVSEADMPSLYLSALSTSIAAMLERTFGAEISSAEELTEASQVLPQDLAIESAVALKSILSGYTWENFTHADTYTFLKNFPDPILIAETLEDTDPTKYAELQSSVINDSNQTIPITEYNNEELILVQSSAFKNRSGRFVLQLNGSTSGNGYLAERLFPKDLDNKITYTIENNETIVNLEGLLPSVSFNDGRESCAPDINGNYSATPIQRSLHKYLDAAAFSSYRIREIYRCDSTNATFSGGDKYAQVNLPIAGNLAEYTQGVFAISTYRHMDPAIFSGVPLWQATVVSPNTNGTVTQRFDFQSGYTDEGALEFLENGRMKLNMNRGDLVEYVPMGTDGSAARVVAILKRADGSAASVGGDLLVPVSGKPTISKPAKLVYSDSEFTITNTESSYFDFGFGFEFLANNTGHQLSRPNGTFEPTALEFSWTQMETFTELQYFYHRTNYYFQPSCPEGDSDCVQFRYRELEPIAEHNGDYFVRVYLEQDDSAVNGAEPGTDVYLSSYIDRFSVQP